MTGRFDIQWIDRGVEPQNKPDRRYPEGIDSDISGGAALSCSLSLPYPAKRCGYYALKCKMCGFNGLVTTAGRADDPRSVKVACLPMGRA